MDFFTNARPKIAAYPFTTKIPNLGVLRVSDERDIILADIPGIIDGASKGLGLGFKFLKHISRTSGLAFLVDLSEENYLDAFQVLLKELGDFSSELTQKPRILIGTKTDVEDGAVRLEKLKERYPGEKVLGISVWNRTGLDEVKQAFIDMVLEAEK